MKGSAARPSMLAMALLLSWSLPHIARPRPRSPRWYELRAGRFAPGRAVLTVVPGPRVRNHGGEQDATSLPPSSVSPAIERFMRQSGGGLAPSTTIDSAGMCRVGTPDGSAVAAFLDAGDRTSGGRSRDAADQPAGSVAPASADAAHRSARAGSRLLTIGPSPLTMALDLKPAPLEPNDLSFPINLATALRLSDARPLIVAAAQASVWVAEAQLTRAKILWVPSVLMAVDYIRHDGGGPDINKGVMTAASVNFFYAGPGLWQYVNLDRCHLRAAGGAAGLELRSLGRSVRQERRPAPDRRRLFPGAPVPRDVRRSTLLRREGA